MSLADRLAARTLELVDLGSPSRDEAAIAEHVAALLRAGDVPLRDAGDSCLLAGTVRRGDRPLVLLAGHLDTVPAQGNIPGRLDDGVVHGVGAADMKGGVAVMLELLLDHLPTTVDVGVVLFGREELPFTESALTPLLEREPELGGADLAVVMEPTGNALQLGCLGNLNATWTFRGRSGHSARPWLADNAIAAAAGAIAALSAVDPVEHELEGLRYTEVVSATGVAGGIAANVIPDIATATINMRYAPGTAPADAEARLRALCAAAGPAGELTIDANAPSGAVPGANPLVERLTALIGSAPQPKQAWTPVAELGALGIDCVNFGPGDPVHAHTRDEQVSAAALARSYEVLRGLLCG